MDDLNQENIPAPKKTGKIWLLVAIVGFIAAFLFQWKNSLDQASIATTDAGDVIRVKTEDPQGYFRIFFNGEKKDFSAPLLYDGNGNAICELKRTENDPELFVCTKESIKGKIPQDRFLHLVFPTLKSENRPVVLVIENPFQK